jgi:hypothetical protein
MKIRELATEKNLNMQHAEMQHTPVPQPISYAPPSPQRENSVGTPSSPPIANSVGSPASPTRKGRNDIIIIVCIHSFIFAAFSYHIEFHLFLFLVFAS